MSQFNTYPSHHLSQLSEDDLLNFGPLPPPDQLVRQPPYSGNTTTLEDTPLDLDPIPTPTPLRRQYANRDVRFPINAPDRNYPQRRTNKELDELFYDLQPPVFEPVTRCVTDTETEFEALDSYLVHYHRDS